MVARCHHYSLENGYSLPLEEYFPPLSQGKGKGLGLIESTFTHPFFQLAPGPIIESINI